MNPLSAVPLYLSLTQGLDAGQRRSTLRAAVLTSVAVLVVFAFVGTLILRFFGITTTAFRVTGGLIFLAVGSDMLQAKRSRESVTEEEEREAGESEDVDIIPLGIPSLAGAGAMTTVITLTAQEDSLADRLVVIAAIVAVMLISWLVLALAPRIFRRFGQTGLNVMTRVTGLLVMVIGTQFIIDGVRAVVTEMGKG